MVAQEPNAADRRRVIRDYALAALILTATCAVYVLAVSPQREFPLNDDWAYAQTVRRLLTIGQLHISDWSSATLIFQVYWGALFTRLFGGFSFTALRWSTLVFSFISCMALYDLLRQLDLSASAAWLGGLTLIVNPIFVYLSYTFMSDVFYLGLMLLSLTLYVRGIKRDLEWMLFVGSILAACAYLVRQLGAMLPLAAVGAIILKERRLRWKPLLLTSALPALVAIGHMYWLRYIHGLPWGFELNTVQNSLMALLRPTMPLYILLRVMNSLLYLGVFSLPVLLAQGVSPRLDRDRVIHLSKLWGIWFTALGILVIFMTVVAGRPMPYLANVINREGIGVLSLAGHKPPVTPGWVFWLVTVVAPFVGAAQGALWTDALISIFREREQPFTLLLIASVLMAIPTLLIVYLWDEYLIVFIPASLYLVLRLGAQTNRWRLASVSANAAPTKVGAPLGWACVLTACGAMMAYTLIEMDDHMAWNAARWTAGERLVMQGIAPEAIDGGFEWIGWHEFDTALAQAIAAGQRDNLEAWQTITPNRFRLAFEPLPGYTVYDQVTYRSPLIGRMGYIYVLGLALP